MMGDNNRPGPFALLGGRPLFQGLGTTTVTTLADLLNYTANVPVPANQLQPGTFKLVAAVTISNLPVAGIIEGPIVQIIPVYPWLLMKVG